MKVAATLLSISALALAVPMEQAQRDTAKPVKILATADKSDKSTLPIPIPIPLPLPIPIPIPIPLPRLPSINELIFGRKQQGPSTFAIAKAAFVGASLGAKFGSAAAGPGAYFGAKYGAQRGVEKGFKKYRRGGGGGGWSLLPSLFGNRRYDESAEVETREAFAQQNEAPVFEYQYKDAEGNPVAAPDGSLAPVNIDAVIAAALSSLFPAEAEATAAPTASTTGAFAGMATPSVSVGGSPADAQATSAA